MGKVRIPYKISLNALSKNQASLNAMDLLLSNPKQDCTAHCFWTKQNFSSKSRCAFESK